PFERPPGFDLAAFWARFASDFERGLPRVPVTALLEPGAVDAARVYAIDVELGAPRPDGRLPATLTFERLEHAAGALLALGAGAELLEPAELRERIVAGARATVARYARDAPAHTADLHAQ